jgi:hypothetical protein
MFTRSVLVRFVLSGAILLAGGVALHAAGVEVNVKGLDGKPVNGAEVRIETAKAGALSVKTDQKGRYVFKNLPTGTYRLVVLVDKVPTSLDNVKARHEGPVRVEFNLKAVAAGKKPKQWAWMKEVGSNFGGRWVEVDESGQIVAGIDRAAKHSGYGLQSEPSSKSSGR